MIKSHYRLDYERNAATSFTEGKEGRVNMVYLVDFENVNSSGLDGIETLSEYDTVVIFYSDKAKSLSLELIGTIQSSKCDIRLFKTEKVQDNYLDFHITSVVGAMVMLGMNVAIISGDKGYQGTLDYWNKDILFHKSRQIPLKKSIAQVEKPKRERCLGLEESVLRFKDIFWHYQADNPVMTTDKKEIEKKEKDADEGLVIKSVVTELSDVEAVVLESMSVTTEQEEPGAEAAAKTKDEEKPEVKPKTKSKSTVKSPAPVKEKKVKAVKVSEKQEVPEVKSKKRLNTFSLPTEENIRCCLNKSKTFEAFKVNAKNMFGIIEGLKVIEEHKDHYKACHAL